MTPEQREREIVSRMAAAHYDAYNDGEQPWDEMGPTSFKAEYAYEFYAVYSKVVAPLLAEAERAGAEQAWDEGHRAGLRGRWAKFTVGPSNPYRADQIAGQP